MNKTYEVEIKSLLGSKDKADSLKKALTKAYPDTKLVSSGKQLNHYFNVPKDFSVLKSKGADLIPEEKKKAFDQIVSEGRKISLRTRDTDGKVLLVMKASVGSDTGDNGVTRIEFEALVPKTLAQLDDILLDSGATYQAKWSREREEYVSGDMHVCLDKNAGYGYLAEFEKVTDDEKSLGSVKTDLLDVMKALGAEELAQDRLERMFAHYNAHWDEYYGTDKTFVIQ